MASLALAAAVWANLSDWALADRLPPGDFAGYAAAVEQTSRWWLEHGRIPRWCVECHGGASVFFVPLKETVAFPLSLLLDPVEATRWTFLGLRWLSALGLAWLFRSLFRAPWIGIAAGYVYAFGAWSNHELAHLEVPMALALLPLLVMACARTLYGEGRIAPAGLAALAVLMFVNSWVQALIGGLVCLLFCLFFWESRAREPGISARAGVERSGRLRRLGAAVGLALVLGASPLAWLVADASNHCLLSPETSAEQRKVWSLRTPLELLNREGALGDWLERHPPPGPATWRFDRGNRYAGGVLIGVAILGAAIDPRGRRAMAWAGGVLLLMLSLATGPYALFEQLGTQLGVGWGLVLFGAVFAPLALAAGLWIRLRGPDRWRRTASALFVLGGAAVLGSASVWESVAVIVPPLQVQRSPGQLAHLAPFPLAVLYGLGLRGIARALPRRRGLAVLVVLSIATVWDYAPSAPDGARGAPMALVREARRAVASLEPEAGTVRLALGPVYAPIQSLIVDNAGPGFASGWLTWQAGRYWPRFLTEAVWPTGRSAETAESIDERSRLLALGRVRYLMTQKGPWPPAGEGLPPPWLPLRAVPPFVIWEQPHVGPFAVHHAFAPVGEPGASTRALAWQRSAPERLRIELPPDTAAGWVFVSQSHHPWWRATADGSEVPVVRVEEAFVGVPVEAGVRELELRLRRPVVVAAADHVSRVAWLGLGVGLVLWAGRRWHRSLRAAAAPSPPPAAPRFD